MKYQTISVEVQPYGVKNSWIVHVEVKASNSAQW